jgi:protein involved in polysaccharide export with SLBB domain
MSRFHNKLLLVVCVASLTLVAAAQTSAPQSSNAGMPGAMAGVPKQNSPTFSQRFPRYRLRPGDAMGLNFQYSPEFNQSVTVQPDGFITLREIGELNVNGLTVPEVKSALETAYSKILAKPEITVDLTNFDKPYFTVAGQVGKPGRYELRGDTTVIEGIALAGGFTSASKHSEVVLVRRVDDQWLRAQPLDIKKLMASKDLSEDVHLQPGDMLIVPQNRFSKIRGLLPNSSFSTTAF